MAEKRVSVRLGAQGGRAVKAELEGVGEAGTRGFGRLSAEAQKANAALAAFAGKAKLAAAGAAAALTAAAGAAVRSGLAQVDAQAKLAQSLGTTVESVQTLARAGDLAGVSQGQLEAAVRALTVRLSQAATGAGPAAKALQALGLRATELAALPLDERLERINAALDATAEPTERAALAAQLYGEKAVLAFGRIDTATLRQAAADVRDFGVAVSEADADQIELTNDAISRLGLVWTGVSNQLAVAAAPGLQAVADALAEAARVAVPAFRAGLEALGENLDRVATYAATFAAFLAARWVRGVGLATLAVRGLSGALVLLRGALIRTGIGALVVGAGELVFQFGRLVRGAGGFGNALALLGDVARGVWEGIKAGGAAVGLALTATWNRVHQGWLTMIAAIQRSWADFLHGFAAELRGIEALEETYLAVANAAIMAGSAVYETEAAATEAARGAEMAWREASEMMGSAFDGVPPALRALREALSSADDGESGSVATAVGRIADEFDRVDAAAKKGGASAAKAGKDAKAGAAEAATGWAAVAAAIRGYTDRTGEWGAELGESIGNGFRSAEQALQQFVETGKLDFKSLVSSILSDLARLTVQQGVTGPLSGFLGNLFNRAVVGGFFGGPDLTADPTPGLFGRALGGPVRSGQAYLVGERGPELFAPGASGRVYSTRDTAAMLRGGAGGVAQQVVLRLDLSSDLDARIVSAAQGVAVETVRSGLASYDRALPARFAAIGRDPRAR